jgi:hypothetical protein
MLRSPGLRPSQRGLPQRELVFWFMINALRSCPVGRMTHLDCRDAPAPAAAPARSSHHAAYRVRIKTQVLLHEN